MAPEKLIFDNSKFQCEYDLNDPQKTSLLQHTIMEFMDEVRKTTSGTSPSIDKSNRALVNEFCEFVDDKEVWHLAQAVIPEFRFSLVEQ